MALNCVKMNRVRRRGGRPKWTRSCVQGCVFKDSERQEYNDAHALKSSPFVYFCSLSDFSQKERIDFIYIVYSNLSLILCFQESVSIGTYLEEKGEYFILMHYVLLGNVECMSLQLSEMSSQ